MGVAVKKCVPYIPKFPAAHLEYFTSVLYRGCQGGPTTPKVWGRVWSSTPLPIPHSAQLPLPPLPPPLCIGPRTRPTVRDHARPGPRDPNQGARALPLVARPNTGPLPPPNAARTAPAPGLTKYIINANHS